MDDMRTVFNGASGLLISISHIPEVPERIADADQAGVLLQEGFQRGAHRGGRISFFSAVMQYDDPAVINDDIGKQQIFIDISTQLGKRCVEVVFK